MIDTKFSSLTNTTYKLMMQFVRSINSDPVIRKAGLYPHIIETGRTQTRQNELKAQGKSWVDYSPHQSGIAFDLVLCWKAFKPLRITKIFWDNSHLYDRIANIANEIGLYSYNLAYKKDAFHFELPIIWQEESDCYAYSVINAIRLYSPEWRSMKKEQARDRAEELQAKAGRQRTSEGTLKVAKELGWIKDFVEIKPHEVTNDMCCICNTRNKYLKGTATEKWRAYLKMVENGQGLPKHATAIKSKTKDGLVIINSHKKPAEYVISDYSRILKVYKIIL